MKIEFSDSSQFIHAPNATTLDLAATDEIELAEISLLKKELERLNFLESFEPKQLELKRLKRALKELEMEKNHFESMGLHRVSTLQLDKSVGSKASSEIVDTVEIESTQK